MASINIIFTPIPKPLNARATGGDFGDVTIYTKMLDIQTWNTIEKPYRYRILTPLLASLIPFPESISKIFTSNDNKSSIIRFKFYIINFIALSLTGIFLFLFLKHLNFSVYESLLGIFLFYISFPIIHFGGVPLVDPLSYFFIISSLYTFINKKYLISCLLIILGFLNKETTVLVLICSFLLPFNKKEKILAILVSLPGILWYSIFRFIISPTNIGYNYGFSQAVSAIYNTFTKPGIIIFLSDFFFYLGFLLFFAFIGFKKNKSLEWKSLFYLIFIILPIPIFIGANLGRIWFYSFPALIPFSLLGIRYLIERS